MLRKVDTMKEKAKALEKTGQWRRQPTRSCGSINSRLQPSAEEAVLTTFCGWRAECVERAADVTLRTSWSE